MTRHDLAVSPASTPRRRLTAPRPRRAILFLLALALPASACEDFFGEEEGQFVVLNPHTSFEAGVAGEAVDELLEIQLLDRDGYPRPGVQVVWSVIQGGGVATPDRSITDQDGVTGTRWTLGDEQEYQKLTAKAERTRVFHFQAYAEGAGGSIESDSDGQSESDGEEATGSDGGGVSPAQFTLTAIGEQRQLTVTLADGTAPDPETVEWSSSHADAVTVDKLGVAVAVGVGAAVITATVGDWSGSSEASVIASSTDGVLMEETFSHYTSTGHFMNDPFDMYTETEDIKPGQIELDLVEGAGGTGGSMRYDFPDRTNSDSRCRDYSIGRNFTFPAELQEVWVEVKVKFSREWDTVAPSSWDCGSNPDYKILGGRVRNWDGSTNGANRFGLLNGNGYNRHWEWDDPDYDHTWKASGGDAVWDGE
ncbi:MAG TPA: Ig-like domain-containing protein, partial [Longimicrobiales bacterium]|nr:Ig-like domain-containing protein [Longimicrobiales bacterium]